MELSTFLIVSNVAAFLVLTSNLLITKNDCVAEIYSASYLISQPAYFWMFYSVYYVLSHHFRLDIAVYGTINFICFVGFAAFFIKNPRYLEAMRNCHESYRFTRRFMISANVYSLGYFIWGLYLLSSVQENIGQAL